MAFAKGQKWWPKAKSALAKGENSPQELEVNLLSRLYRLVLYYIETVFELAHASSVTTGLPCLGLHNLKNNIN